MPKYGPTIKGQPRDDRGVLASRGLTIVERLWLRVDIRQAHECWPWLGGVSRGGRTVGSPYGPQSITYGVVKESTFDGDMGRARCWRTHQIAGLLKPEVEKEIPRDPDELLNAWLRRAWRHYTKNLLLEVSHQCDNSMCCNPGHLEWESHMDNLAFHRYRKKQREADPTWQPVCCLPPELGGYGWSRERFGDISEIRRRLEEQGHGQACGGESGRSGTGEIEAGSHPGAAGRGDTPGTGSGAAAG